MIHKAHCTMLQAMFLAATVTGLLSTPANAEYHCLSIPPAPPDMISWWPLDETSGNVAVDIQSGINGTILFHGAPSGFIAGKVDGAYQLGDSSYIDIVQIANDARLNFGNHQDFTIDAWITRPSFKRGGIQNTPRSLQPFIIFKKISSIGIGYEFFLSADGYLGLNMYGPGPSNRTFSTSTQVEITTTEHHVAVTVDRDSDVTFFVDGVVFPRNSGNGITNGVNVSSSADAQIGPVGEALDLAGIDEVEIFGRALAQSEVQTIATRGKCKPFNVISVKNLPLNINKEFDVPFVIPPSTSVSVSVNCNGSTQNIVLESGNNYSGSVFVSPGATCTVIEDVSTLPAPPQDCQWNEPTYDPVQQVSVSPISMPNGNTVTITNTVTCSIEFKTNLEIKKEFDNSNGNMPFIPPSAVFPVTISGCTSSPSSVDLSGANGYSATVGVSGSLSSCVANEGPPVGITPPFPSYCRWETQYDYNLQIQLPGPPPSITVTNKVVCEPPEFKTEHFQCYDIADRPEMKIPVKLTDQFGSSDNTVIRPIYLCAPVDKNGEGMKNGKDHLLFYELERQVSAGKLVEVENQFGKQRFKVLGSRLLGVPSIKKVIEEPKEIDFGIKKIKNKPLGAAVPYSIQVDNHGGDLAVPPATLQVVDHVPAGMIVSFYPTTDWACPTTVTGPADATCNWTGPSPVGAGNLPPINLMAYRPSGGPYRNCAEVIIGGGATDVHLADNKSGACGVSEGNPDLEIEKSAVSPVCIAGQSCNFEVVVRNNGTAPSTAPLSINDSTTPTGATLSSITQSGQSGGWGSTPLPQPQCSLPAQTPVNCPLSPSTIPPGQWVSYTFSFDVPANATSGSGKNCVDLVGQGQVFGHSCAGVEVKGRDEPPVKVDLGVDKKLLPGVADPYPGGMADFEITVFNANGQVPSGSTIPVQDTLPPGFTFQGVISGPWNCGPVGSQTFTCTYTGPQPLASGWSSSFTIHTQIATNAQSGRQCAKVGITPHVDVNPKNDNMCIGVNLPHSPPQKPGRGTGPINNRPKYACVSGLRSAKSTLNMRETPDRTARVSAKLRQGTALQVLQERGKWLFVQVLDNGRPAGSGWVASRYTRPVDTADACDNGVAPIKNAIPVTPKNPGKPITKTVACVANLPDNWRFLSLRDGPSSRARRVGTLLPGTALQVLDRQGGWSRVRPLTSDGSGWVISKYIRDVDKRSQCTVYALKGVIKVKPAKPSAGPSKPPIIISPGILLPLKP